MNAVMPAAKAGSWSQRHKAAAIRRIAIDPSAEAFQPRVKQFYLWAQACQEVEFALLVRRLWDSPDDGFPLPRLGSSLAKACPVDSPDAQTSWLKARSQTADAGSTRGPARHPPTCLG